LTEKSFDFSVKSGLDVATGGPIGTSAIGVD